MHFFRCRIMHFFRCPNPFAQLVPVVLFGHWNIFNSGAVGSGLKWWNGLIMTWMDKCMLMCVLLFDVRFLMVDAEGTVNQTASLFEYNEKKGADMALNLKLTELAAGCDSKCVNDLIHDWISSQPEGRWGNWQVRCWVHTKIQWHLFITRYFSPKYSQNDTQELTHEGEIWSVFCEFIASCPHLNPMLINVTLYVVSCHHRPWYRQLIARLQYLHCYRTGDTAVFH